MVELWDRAVREYYSPNTGLFYTRKVKELPGPEWYKPEDEYRKGNYRTTPYKKGDKETVGYNLHGGGTGTEDCSLFGGILLSALCDWYKLSPKKAVVERARMVLKGLVCAATVHGQPGFVARGVCHQDGRSIFPGSSRDQFTHAIHGMWRFYHSPMSTREERDRIREILGAIADKMTREITPENDYSFRFAYDLPDDRGVAKMRYGSPFGAARLAMFYAAAWDTGRKKEHFDLYRAYLPEAIEGTRKIPVMMTDGEKRFIPAYCVLQVSASLELLCMVEPEAEARDELRTLMDSTADFVAGSEYFALAPRCPRDRAEILHGIMMAPDYRLSDEQQELLRSTVTEVDGSYVESSYTVLGAYWRARLKGYYSPVE